MNHYARELLEKIHNAGIILRVDGDYLRYCAPAGTMTPELRAALTEIKPDLIFEYHERAGIFEYDANMPRTEAEHQAAADVLQAQAKQTG